ncbi:hypothetical protein BGE01nite_20330 [Brevifollis gellanilyticus]|uniref:Uncharacterized protein n=1 Tax=Brevifollis gellanilyticus TaxID=748831 RepID=A0A512M7M6_9BACT|nr:hypothetical protein BGE01nite_20330 [Brevifollis gellanilyticus]
MEAASCQDAVASASAGNLEGSPSAALDNPSDAAGSLAGSPWAVDTLAASLPLEEASSQAASGSLEDSPSDTRAAASCQAAWDNQEDNQSAVVLLGAVEAGAGQKVAVWDP